MEACSGEFVQDLDLVVWAKSWAGHPLPPSGARAAPQSTTITCACQVAASQLASHQARSAHSGVAGAWLSARALCKAVRCMFSGSGWEWFWRVDYYREGQPTMRLGWRQLTGASRGAWWCLDGARAGLALGLGAASCF